MLKIRALQIYADNITTNKNFIALGNRIKQNSNGSYEFQTSIGIYKNYNSINSDTEFKICNLNFVDKDRN